MYIFKVGDPVVRYYKHLNDFGNDVYFIKMINNNEVQLAQEVHPSSHFFYGSLSKIKLAKFTKRKHKDLQMYREQAIKNAILKTEISI